MQQMLGSVFLFIDDWIKHMLNISSANTRGCWITTPHNTRLPLALGSALWLFAACASVPAPTQQIALSTAAVANAVSAGGPEWAAPEMRLAREKLDRANAAMATKDYEQARMLAHEAQADAQLAAAKSRANKAQKAADVMQEDSRVLAEELDRKSKATSPINTTPRN
jgi:hypothetical protein